MKITKKQYEKAKAMLPKLEEAKTLCEQWETAMRKNDFQGMDVIAIESGEDGFVASVRPQSTLENSEAA